MQCYETKVTQTLLSNQIQQQLVITMSTRYEKQINLTNVSMKKNPVT